MGNSEQPKSVTDDASEPVGLELGSLSRAELEALVVSQLDAISKLEAVVGKQHQTNAELVRHVAVLEEQLGFDGPDAPSRDSGPSDSSGDSAGQAKADKRTGKATGAVKPNKPPQERKKRKPRAKSFSRPREEPTASANHYPKQCGDCGRHLKGGGRCWSRQVVDLTLRPVEIIEHVFHSRWCGGCKKRVTAKSDLAGLVSGRRRFGHNLVSLIASLHIDARVPLATIQNILKCQFSVHVSTGEMVDLMAMVARKGEGAIEAIKQEIRSNTCKHSDETGWRENGQYKCLWSLSTKLSRWFHIDPHRTSEVIHKLLGPKIIGTLVTDFLYTYNSVPGRHQRCWAHFKRALDELQLEHPDNSSLHQWIAGVIRIWSEAREYRAFCLSKPKFGAGVFDRRRKRRQFETELYALAEPHLEADSATWPQATLARRIAMFLNELFTFVEFTEVPDDNNAAERSIRPAVIIRKVCGGTRSEKGTQVKAALMTLFGTWKARGKDPIKECRALLTASP